MSRRVDRRGWKLGVTAFLVRVSDSGKALQADVVPHHGARSIRTWIPISQVHEDSEVYGIDNDGKRQAKGESGSLIVTHWFGEQPEPKAEFREKGIPLHAYEGSEP